MGTDRLAALSVEGVSIWLDDLSRERLTDGSLAKLVDQRGVVGVTTNPTIFAHALADSAAYDEQIRDLAARDADIDSAIHEIAVTDVRLACDLLSDVWKRTGGVDGRVSLEVDPHLADDTDRTVAQAHDLWTTVDRPNLMIKVPATEAGLPAITRIVSEGISVNVTLIFSVERYQAVMDAYQAGLELAFAKGRDLATVHSVASFFVSRVDSEVDSRLARIGDKKAIELQGRAAVANSRLAYAAHRDALSEVRWRNLQRNGANVQRPLWASTGVKNLDYPDTLYVTELVVRNTVNTMPEKTLNAFADHGEIRGDRVTGTVAGSQQVFRDLEDAGIKFDDICSLLENEGVAKFKDSWTELRMAVQSRLDIDVAPTE